MVEERDGLRVLLAGATDGIVDDDVATAVLTALRDVGVADLNVRVERVDRIPQTALGKAPLVRAIRRGAPAAS